MVGIRCPHHLCPHPSSLHKDAIEETFRSFVRCIAHRTISPKRLAEIDVRLLTQCIDAVLEKLAETFNPFKSGEDQDVRPKWRFKGRNTLVLTEPVHGLTVEI